MMPQSMMQGPAAVGPYLTIQICRLLDMPIEKDVLGSKKGYRVKVYDDFDHELDSTDVIEAPHSSSKSHVNVHPRDGTLEIRTKSQELYLVVEHAGGLMSSVIGQCKIHRLDPRSSQIWPYLLDKDGDPADCGIELKVIEAMVPPGSMPSGRLSTGRPSFTSPFGSGLVPPQAAMQDLNHGVSAVLELDKVIDIPQPRSSRMRKVLITLLAEDRNQQGPVEKELRRVGPFKVQEQQNLLVTADCLGSRIYVQPTMHFGGDANEGAMYLKIRVSYVQDAKVSKSNIEIIGVTALIKVTWQRTAKKYYEIRQQNPETGGTTDQVLGGIYLSHHLMTDAEVANENGKSGSTTPKQQQAHSAAYTPQSGMAMEGHAQISGRTGNFPMGSPEEAYEQAAINSDAQNRALLQRCKSMDPTMPGGDPRVQTIAGYRQWDSLDSLFATIGPNPMAFSEEVGPTIARSYVQSTSVAAELQKKMVPPNSPADEILNAQLMKMMCNGSPFKEEGILRPVICKDPNEIAMARDMTWSPDPPHYAPLKNLRQDDLETLRLACFHPTQSANLTFADANPNYDISEDVWALTHAHRPAMPFQEQRPLGMQPRRVKDDCIMA
jgi:hypothetical protein